MDYKVVLTIDDLDLLLFKISVSKDEVQNLVDSLRCEIDYNGFDIRIP